MRFSIPTLIFMATIALGEPTSTYDIGELTDQLSSLAALFPAGSTSVQLPAEVTSVMNQLPTPSGNLAYDIITAIPASVYAALMDSKSRESLKSDFKESNYPTWYEELPTSIKSYFSEFAGEMSTASITYHPTGAMATGGLSLGTSTVGGDSTQGSGGDDESAAASLSSYMPLTAWVLAALVVLLTSIVL